MVHSFCADKRKSCLADPPPKLDILLVAVRLQALLGLEVEQLQCPALCLESYDGLSQVHDGAISTNWSPNDVIRVLEVDDDSLGGSVGFVIDLAHTDILVGLECLNTMLVFICHRNVLGEAAYTVLP